MYQPYHLKIAAIVLVLLLLNTYAPAQHFSQASICTTSPYPVTVPQADGSRLTIIGKGTIRQAWTETLDGYTVIKQNGTYQYARKVNGKLVSSGLAARNPSERKSKDAAFLKRTPKSIRTDITNKELSPFPLSRHRTAKTQQASFSSTGTMKALLILIKFPNLNNKHAAGNFNNLMNQTNYRGTGSFKDFFATSSNGKLIISTDVFGWYTAKNTYAFYGNQNGSVQATQLVREAVDAAQKAGVDFSKYDNNKDGKVDGVIVAHAGPGAEEGAQLEYIWSHRWELSAGSNQVTYDGVLIDEYIINPETRIATNDMVGRGIFCHEFGHNLGLPDLYDTDGGSEGTGEWSLMAGGGWLGNEHTPGNLCAWSKSQLGWITPKVLTTAGTYSLNAASNSTECYRINTGVNNEYFLLENRQKTGLDVSLPGSGLAIWHVNASQTSMYPLSNLVNADKNLKGVDLEEADGLRHLDSGTNRGDAGDLFPGSGNKRTFNNTSNPNAKTYASSNSKVSITQITVGTGGKISFTYGNPAVSPPAPTTVRINCGGPAVTTDGVTFVADQYFSSTSAARNNTSVGDIASTTNDAIYHYYRNAAATGGSFNYTIPVANGTYQIRLNFAEIYYNKARERIFSVNLEGGATELSNFDIFAAAGGAKKMITKVFTIPVNDGKLDIDFTSSVGKAMISAIQVIPASTARKGVEETAVAQNRDLNVYPVPSAGAVTVEFTPDAEKPAVVEVFDAKGALASRHVVNAAQAGRVSKVTVDGNQLQPGVYVVKVQSAGKVAYKKLIIAR